MPDRSDNCQSVSNAAQEDEDGDDVGNACDNCPAVANTPQNNADADALGDACDPGPSPHTLLFFDGFDGPLDTAAWATEDGAWSTALGDLVQPDSDDAITPLLYLINATPGAAFEVTLAFRFTAYFPFTGTNTANFGVAFGMDRATNNGWNGAAYHVGGIAPEGGLGIYELMANSAGSPAAGLHMPDIPLQEDRVLVLRVNGTAVQVTQGTYQVSHTLPTPPTGFLGLRTRRAAVRVQYIQVVGVGG